MTFWSVQGAGKCGVMYAKVRYVDFQKYSRVIVISDIHGDKDGFTGVLGKVKFGKEDALVIVGDILEKGKYALELLHVVMELYMQGNVYLVAGNNDTIFLEWFQGQVSVEDVLWYVKNRKYSILKDMAGLLKLPYETAEDIRVLKVAIKRKFAKELAFLEGVPHILDCEFATFVHAGLKPGSLEEQDPEYCLTATEFAVQPHVFDKKVIVGHWPSSNYSAGIIEANIYRNRKTNVISIDGGNSMKRWQQINYLIFDNMGRELECGYYDNLPKIQALEDQEESENFITLLFPHTEVVIREVRGKESVCYVPWLDQEIVIDSSRIYEYKRKTYCSDMTTYCLPVKAGEILSFCGMTPEGLQVKMNGVIGNYHGPYAEICEV